MTSFRSFRAVALVSKAVAAIVLVASGSAFAQSITMASTTSTEQSGLFGYLLPEFKKASGLDIKVVALGTGQALDMARRGDADVLFVHDQGAEEKFVADGWGVKRYPVMYNDFILIGPRNDPAESRSARSTAPMGDCPNRPLTRLSTRLRIGWPTPPVPSSPNTSRAIVKTSTSPLT